jgi:hypothetical protein
LAESSSDLALSCWYPGDPVQMMNGSVSVVVAALLSSAAASLTMLTSEACALSAPGGGFPRDQERDVGAVYASATVEVVMR